MEYQAAMPSLVATGNNDGFGMGGGLLGGLVLGSVLNRGFGNFGGGYGYGAGMPCGSYGYGGIDGLNNLQGAIDTNAILSNLADIKAAVPLAEGQMQLALAGAQSDITQQNQAQTLALTNQLFAGQLSNVQGFANTKDAVDSLSTQVAIGQGVTNTNIERLGWQLSATVKDDGEKTRALITSNQIAELNRIAAERQDEILELRNEGRRRDDRHGIEINMINNQTQVQAQLQQQQQQIGSLIGCLHGIDQNIRATNQQLIIGNTGVTTGGAQTSNPTNVKA